MGALVRLRGGDRGLPDGDRDRARRSGDRERLLVRRESENGGLDYQTIQYDAEGNELWSRRIERESYYGHFWWIPISPAIVADSAGNVYLTGSIGPEGAAELLLVKYDVDGDELVHQRLPQYAEGRDIVLDDQDRVYVSAPLLSGDRYRATVVAFAPDGSVRWQTSTDEAQFVMPAGLSLAGGKLGGPRHRRPHRAGAVRRHALVGARPRRRDPLAGGRAGAWAGPTRSAAPATTSIALVPAWPWGPRVRSTWAAAASRAFSTSPWSTASSSSRRTAPSTGRAASSRQVTTSRVRVPWRWVCRSPAARTWRVRLDYRELRPGGHRGLDPVAPVTGYAGGRASRSCRFHRRCLRARSCRGRVEPIGRPAAEIRAGRRRRLVETVRRTGGRQRRSRWP